MSSNRHKAVHRAKTIPPWYFLGFLLISLIVTGFALRSNYAQMDTLREAVYAADERGEGVEQALQELQAYVTSHMNTDLSGDGTVYPPIQLQKTYERLVMARSEQLTGDNTQMYQDAQRVCEQQIPTGFSGSNRIACIQDYVQQRTQAGPLPAIPDALYKFSFVSPRWSPDFAGWMVALTILLAATTAISTALYIRERHLARRS